MRPISPGPIAYDPSSPMKGIAARTQAKVTYNDGSDPKAAAKLAKTADVVIVFATRWEAESVDVATLSLPDNQDALIDAVAAANKRTVVVLETGGPVAMPRLAKAVRCSKLGTPAPAAARPLPAS